MKIHILDIDYSSQKIIAQACIKFTDLQKKAIFTYRKDPNVDIYVGEENSLYQRELNPTRVKSIVGYLRAAILQNKNNMLSVVFPTAMLLACDYDTKNFIKDRPNDDEGIQARQHDDIEIDPPNDFFIVDGQHRLGSMKKLYEYVHILTPTSDDLKIKSYLDSFEFNCTILINFDVWEQAQVFADVNFNQKSVNKSFYFEIYGMQYPENDTDKYNGYIYLAHRLVEVMNTNDKSPLKGKIKMLGTGVGLISQSCLGEALMEHMSSPLGIWSYPKITGNNRHMTIELISYYYAVEHVFKDYWPIEMKHRSIICKTTGVYAFIKLMGYIHAYKLSDKVKQDLKNMSSVEICKAYVDEIKPMLELLAQQKERLFAMKDSKDPDRKDYAQFSGTGGKGLATRLYQEMVSIIENY